MVCTSTVSDNSQWRSIIGHHARTQTITRENIHNYIYIQKKNIYIYTTHINKKEELYKYILYIYIQRELCKLMLFIFVDICTVYINYRSNISHFYSDNQSS